MTAPRIWIVVADGETARIYSALGRTARLEQALPYELRMPDPPTREQGADKPGRVFDSHGAGRHAIQPHADWHREAKHQFAREIAELWRRRRRRTSSTSSSSSRRRLSWATSERISTRIPRPA